MPYNRAHHESEIYAGRRCLAEIFQAAQRVDAASHPSDKIQEMLNEALGSYLAHRRWMTLSPRGNLRPDLYARRHSMARSLLEARMFAAGRRSALVDVTAESSWRHDEKLCGRSLVWDRWHPGRQADSQCEETLRHVNKHCAIISPSVTICRTPRERTSRAWPG